MRIATIVTALVLALTGCADTDKKATFELSPAQITRAVRQLDFGPRLPDDVSRCLVGCDVVVHRYGAGPVLHRPTRLHATMYVEVETHDYPEQAAQDVTLQRDESPLRSADVDADLPMELPNYGRERGSAEQHEIDQDGWSGFHHAGRVEITSDDYSSPSEVVQHHLAVARRDRYVIRVFWFDVDRSAVEEQHRATLDDLIDGLNSA